MTYIELEEIQVKHTTDKAVLIDLEGEDFWVPWSCIEDNGEKFKEGYSGPMYVAEWFAEKEGLT